MHIEFDAVIIGAGPAGSAAAILLARAGWSVALVEKQPFPRRKVCGECIAASNLPLLAALGIGCSVDASAGPELRQVAFMRGEQTVVADLPPAMDAMYRWGRALGREILDTLLLDQARATGAEVLQPWSVQAVRGSAGDWHCEVRAVETGAIRTLRAAVVVDAHGSWQALPAERKRWRATQKKDSDLFAFKANFRDTALADGLLPVLSFPGGYGGMVVGDGGMTTLACCIRRDRLDACRYASPGLRAGDAVEVLLKRECAGVRDALQAATRVGAWLAAGPLNPGIRVRAEDEIFRIGNAAGEAHPIIGEGMSMALQSAWLLAARLLRDGRPGATNDRAWQRRIAIQYARQWRRQFTPRLWLAATFAHLAMRPATSAPLMALVQMMPELLTLGATLGGKTRSAVDQQVITQLVNKRAQADLR